MSEHHLESIDDSRHDHHHPLILFVDGIEATTQKRLLSGIQIRELGDRDRVHGYKTEIVTGHVRVLSDHEEVEVRDREHFRTVIEIYLDGEIVLCHSKTLTGRQIRELGPPDRVDGFETQEVTEHGKKIRTIGDSESVQVHEHEHFRTVPNHGGPGAAV